MRREYFVQQLLHDIDAYGLEDRFPDQITPIIRMAQHGMLSNSMARPFLLKIQDLIDGAKDFPNFLHRPPAEEQWYARGRPTLELGSLVEAPGLRFGFDLSGGQHGGFIGMTGSGKTVAARCLITKIHEWNQTHPESFVSIIITDPKGGDFADCKELLGSRCKHFSIHDGLRIGTNGPGHVPPKIWINYFSTCFAARASLKASVVCMANQMIFCVSALNPKPQSQLLWPDFSLLLDIAKYAPLTLFASKPEYEKSYIQKLEQVAYETCFQTFAAIDLQKDIIDKHLHAVIDTCALESPWVKLLFSDILAGQLLLGRQYAFRKQSHIDTFLIRDEADSEVSAESERAFPDGGMSPASRIEKQLRESGVAQILLLSALGPVSRQVLTNMVNICLLRVGDADSLMEARRTFLLRPGAEAILPAMEDGQCILRINNGWPHAVLGKFDYVPPSRVLRPEAFDSHPYIPSKPLQELPHVLEALEKLITQHKQSKMRRGKNAKVDKNNLSQNAYELIHAIPSRLWAPAQVYWKSIGEIPSPNIQKSVCQELADHGLAESAIVRLGSANILLYRLTDAGWDFVKCKPPVRIGRGEIPHQHISHWCAMVGQLQGLKTKCEFIAPGTNHPIDCAWQVETNRWDAFEIVISCTNLTSHLTTLSNCDNIRNITIVCTQKKIVLQLQKQLLSEPVVKALGDRLHWELAETFLRRLWP